MGVSPRIVAWLRAAGHDAADLEIRGNQAAPTATAAFLDRRQPVVLRSRFGAACEMASDHNHFANLSWEIADLLQGPCRLLRYERVMELMTVLLHIDGVLAATRDEVDAEYKRC